MSELKNGNLGEVDKNVNLSVQFSRGQVPDILKRLEEFLGFALSFRSTSGEVVAKTDYFYGPCSLLRGTEIGRRRCRRTYKNIEDQLLLRKMPYATICYGGFLIFAVPLGFRGEMIGTLLGSQILPITLENLSEMRAYFAHTISLVGLKDEERFFKSLEKVRCLEPDFQRTSFLGLLEKIGENFSKLAFSGMTWPQFYREIKDDIHTITKF